MLIGLGNENCPRAAAVRFLTRVELPVPSFRQGDDKWGDDPLGGVLENGTIGGAGCAVAAAAMVFKFYGIDVDPQQLNWFLTATGGYTDQGWLYWDRAASIAPIGSGTSTKTCLRIN